MIWSFFNVRIKIAAFSSIPKKWYIIDYVVWKLFEKLNKLNIFYLLKTLYKTPCCW